MSLPAGAGVALPLRLPSPFGGAALLDFLARHAVTGVEVGGPVPALSASSGPDGGYRYARTLALPGGPAVLRLEWTAAASGMAAASGSGRGMVATGWCAPADVVELTARAHHLLDAASDVAAAEAVLGRDPQLRPLLAATPGLRVPGSVDAAETLLRTMLGQQVSLAAARTLGARLTAAHGVELARRPGLDLTSGPLAGLDRLFPSPAALAALDPTTLPMPRARARALVEVAARLADGRLDPDAPSSDADLRARLLACPGIGPWTADYVLMRVRHHPDVLLVGDLVIARELAAGGHVDTAGWAPWRSYATMHLWHDFLQRA